MKRTKGYEAVLQRIAKNIQHYRRMRDLTQEDMADFGFNYRHFQKLESGRYSPNLETLYKVASVLKVDLADLLK